MLTTQQIYHLEESLQLSLYFAITGGTVQVAFSQPEGQFPSDVKTTENVSKEERGFR